MRLLLIDDHPLVAQALQAVFQHEPDFELVGFVTNGRDALSKYQELQPDMLLVDLRLPGESGMEIIKALRSKHPETKCVILTSSSIAQEIREALEMGVDGYILKDVLPDELMEALKRVASGRKHYDQKAMEVLVRSQSGDCALLSELTERELEVLRELARGKSNRQIAERLWITDSTVKKHISAILVKLNLNDRTQAALFAVRHGLTGVS